MLHLPTLKNNNFFKRKTTLMKRLFTRKGTTVRELDMEEVLRSWTKIAGENNLMLNSTNQNELFEKVVATIFEEEDMYDIFNVKGPMGKGLCIEPSGVHVAFCAGTGVLVFLDLVSHLLLRSYYKHYVDVDKVPAHMN